EKPEVAPTPTSTPEPVATHAPFASEQHAEEPLAVVETVEEVHEYEPEDASASHRVESPRSEFRFASVEEVEEEEIVEEEEEAPAPFTATDEEPESVAPHAAEAATTPASEPTSAESEVVRQLFGYAPGMGVLEEETIDDDEYDFEPIPGQPEEHLTEELEEETLDQSSTLGDAGRHVHINKRLGYGPPEVEEEEEEGEETETGFAEVEEEEFEGEESDEEESDE